MFTRFIVLKPLDGCSLSRGYACVCGMCSVLAGQSLTGVSGVGQFHGRFGGHEFLNRGDVSGSMF